MLQKGFTLIELMIVVAIIGILSMFALPAYQDYTKRTYVSEGMALATAAKLSVTEQFATEGKWAENNKDAGLQAPDAIKGQSVNAISVGLGDGGINDDVTTAATDVSNISIFYNTKVISGATAPANANDAATPVAADANSLTIAPVFDAATAQGSIIWVCREAGTSLEKKWLPSNCRTQEAQNNP